MCFSQRLTIYGIVVIIVIVSLAMHRRRRFHSALEGQPLAASTNTPEAWNKLPYAMPIPRASGFWPADLTPDGYQEVFPTKGNDLILDALDANLYTVYTANEIPKEVRHQYGLIFQEGPRMVDRDQQDDSHKYLDRLMFCAFNFDEAVLVYESPSEKHAFHAIIFWFEHEKRVEQSAPRPPSQKIKGEQNWIVPQLHAIETPGPAYLMTISKFAAGDIASLRYAVKHYQYLDWGTDCLLKPFAAKVPTSRHKRKSIRQNTAGSGADSSPLLAR